MFNKKPAEAGFIVTANLLISTHTKDRQQVNKQVDKV